MAGDICLYDKTNDKLIIVKNEKWNIKTYPKESFTPIGVVAVPGTHNVYGDNSCGVISLKYMSDKTPNEGSNEIQNFYSEESDNGIANLNGFNEVCVVGFSEITYVGDEGIENPIFELYPQVIDSLNTYCLPSISTSTIYTATLATDVKTEGAFANPYDKDAYYLDKFFSSSIDCRKYFCPSPYNDDDTRNPEYYRVSSPSSSENAFSDFNGLENTKKILDAVTIQNDWKTASTITNSSDKGCYPSACCCWRYFTEGTKQGDWYLPSIGEFGYVTVKFQKINNTINKLLNAYGTEYGSLIDRFRCWSSTLAFDNSNKFWVLELYDGLAQNDYQGYQASARSILRVY